MIRNRGDNDVRAVHRDSQREYLKGGVRLAPFSRACGWESGDDWNRVSGVRGEPQGAEALQGLRVPREAIQPQG